MNLTDLAIRHRLTVYVLMVLIVVIGASAYTSLPLESFPEIKIPLILVSTSYQGVSPADMETLVTRPLETEIRGISGIKEIRSTSSEGFSMIEVEFNPEVRPRHGAPEGPGEGRPGQERAASRHRRRPAGGGYRRLADPGAAS